MKQKLSLCSSPQKEGYFKVKFEFGMTELAFFFKKCMDNMKDFSVCTFVEIHLISWNNFGMKRNIS